MENLIRITVLGILAAVGMVSTVSTHAQLNEKKVERDATGVYKGQKSGGTYTLVTNQGDPPVTIPLPTNSGKLKMPVKSKNPMTTLVDDEIVGGVATFTGQRQKTKVARSGKKVKYTAGNGFAYTQENAPGVNPWMNGEYRGPYKDKGTKWKATGTSGGVANFSNPDTGYTETEYGTGMKSTGKH